MYVNVTGGIAGAEIHIHKGKGLIKGIIIVESIRPRRLVFMHSYTRLRSVFCNVPNPTLSFLNVITTCKCDISCRRQTNETFLSKICWNLSLSVFLSLSICLSQRQVPCKLAPCYRIVIFALAFVVSMSAVCPRVTAASDIFLRSFNQSVANCEVASTHRLLTIEVELLKVDWIRLIKGQSAGGLAICDGRCGDPSDSIAAPTDDFCW